ncbi:hypothetical protein D6D17_05924 [Aureobasidium pullulans]|uniref:DUF1445-domain-containing protein n=1 Tax=Aureobasidium pullulans TaxID=5580 RepID=A0A4S9CBM1_AURPU|nr:hypothetical protein D6D22_10530 [Aureobasidium pullulans]THX03570.1 hypothetical protein D6D17_05924 [Aureobasidium pullulans]THX68631.1 hypothetical protein D6D04_10527 [Aureobasidium pullulans]THZ36926.1 hypothetical protein D6C90_06862 [Aureobasidium pullulans]TIA67351.1 hypothetical protein D6C76_08740 [Aureobasidium pullulans]
MAKGEASTGVAVRLAARDGTLNGVTSGLAPSYLQANLIVLPSRYATDFRLLCARNPVPCPLLAESAQIGSYDSLMSYIDGLEGDRIASDIDIRHDAPRYMVYQDGRLTISHITNITSQWTEDHVAFLIGCSYSFETALIDDGLPPRHTVMGRNVPMYRTNIPLCPAGAFTGSTYVVSMRPYKRSDIERVRDITRPFVTTHGEPIAWGWHGMRNLGIADINSPNWGDAPVELDGQPLDSTNEDVVPVFWGCGVTPQEAVMKAGLKGTVLGHAPGHMILLDVKDEDVFTIA